MSLFLGQLTDAPQTENTRIVIINAKDNWKYRRGKPKSKYQRRVRDPDVEQFNELARENGINMGYDGSCDTIWFETRAIGEDIVLEGRDTGGQFIRTMIQVAINSGNGREVSFEPVVLPTFLESDRFVTTKDGRTIRKNGKSNMLVGVQMRMWSMRIGDSVEIHGGDPLNDDALSWDNHISLFKIFSESLGINFHLENLTEKDGVAHFRLTRVKNSIAFKSSIYCDIHTADQVLMALMGMRSKWIRDTDGSGGFKFDTTVNKTPFHRITMRFPKSRDYHPEAMIYALRSFGFLVNDSKPDGLDDEGLKTWIEKGGLREVSVYC